MWLLRTIVICFLLSIIAFSLSHCRHESTHDDRISYSEDVLYDILYYREHNDIPSLKWYLLQIDSQNLLEDIKVIYDIEMSLHFDTLIGPNQALIKSLKNLIHAVDHEVFKGRHELWSHFVNTHVAPSGPFLKAYIKALAIPYIQILKLDANIIASLTCSDFDYNNPSLKNYTDFLDQYYFGKKLSQEMNYQAGMYTLQALISNMQVNHNATYPSLLSCATFGVLVNMLNTSDLSHFDTYKNLLIHNVNVDYISEQWSLLNAYKAAYDNNSPITFLDYYYHNCKFYDSAKTDLSENNMNEKWSLIPRLDDTFIDIYEYEEYVNYACHLIEEKEILKANEIFENLTENLDKYLVNEDPGYKLNMLSKYFDLLLDQCYYGDSTACDVALQVLQKIEQLMSTEQGMTDFNHYSSFINDHGLSELNIWYQLDNIDDSKVYEIFLKSKNRFLLRNLMINKDNQLNLRQKEILTDLQTQFAKLSVSIENLLPSEVVISPTHNKRKLIYEKMTSVYTNTSNLKINDFRDFEEVRNISKDLKTDLYIDFINDEKFLYIFTLLNGKVDLVKKPYREALIKHFTDIVMDRKTPLDSIYSQGQELYQYLFDHVPEGGYKSITICPSGGLNYFPFCALMKGAKYFIDDYSINYVPNVSYYQIMPRQVYKSIALLPYTKPFDMTDDAQLLPLPFASQEVIMIGDIMGINKNILSQSKLNHKTVLGGFKSDIFHVSTHAISDEYNKFGNYITYYSDSDFKIYGFVLESKKLKTNLVVLNACSTDRGALYQGEGTFSLTNSLLKSGVKQVVTTTHTVNDQSSSKMMEYFYTSFKNKQFPEIALQSSQRQMAQNKKFNHPYFWAGYRIYGLLNHNPKI